MNLKKKKDLNLPQQAAQEREELRQKADLLDAEIHRTERENRALQNTEQLISNCNSAFRKSLQRAHGSSESEPSFLPQPPANSPMFPFSQRPPVLYVNHR